MRQLTFCMLIGVIYGHAAFGAESVIALPDLEVVETLDASGGTGVESAISAASVPRDLAVIQWLPQGIGSQSDLSIRGSRFSGAGFSLSGLSLRNAQTEHFNAALPVPLGLFDRPEVLTGLDQVLGATGHLVGSIDLGFRPVMSGGCMTLGIGERGTDLQRGLVQYSPRDSPVGLSLFGARHDTAGFDYSDNESLSESGGLHLQYVGGPDQVDIVGAYQEREFGARGFYGVSPNWRSWESTEDLLVFGTWRRAGAGMGDYVRTSLSTRRFSDDYLLDRNSPSFYRNQHDTWMSSAAADGVVSVTDDLFVTWRGFAEDERIDSSGLYLGSSSDGLGNHDRQRAGMLLMPGWQSGPWRAHAGAQTMMFSGTSADFLLLAGLQRSVGNRHTAVVQYTESVRQPSFTELDYESPTSLGNRGLDNETRTTIEAGVTSAWSRRVRTSVTVFRRQTSHTVDWIRNAPGGRWLATDVGTVDTTGLTVDVSTEPTPGCRLGILYQYLDKSGDLDPYASRYAFNYPEHRAVLTVRWSPCAWLEVGMSHEAARFRQSPARHSDRYGIFSDAVVTVRTDRIPTMTLSLKLRNLLDDDLQLYPGQPPAQRHVLATCSVRW